MTITGTAGWRSLTVWRSCSPEGPGIRMSETSTWGGPLLNASRASDAEGNERKAIPSRARAFSNTHRIERSSSTIQTGFIGFQLDAALRASAQWQQDCEHGAAGTALAFDHSAVVLYERLRKRQPETASTFPP